MVITLTVEQQKKLLAWAGEIATAHVNAECEPPGYTLRIEVGGPLGSDASAVCGSSKIELGDVSLQLS